MANLQGKVALITGSSKGIGAAIAQRLAAGGASVVINYSRSAAPAEALVQRIQSAGGKAVAVQADLSNPAQIPELISETTKAFGRLDILINNAGAGNYKPFVNTSVEEYDHLMDANMKSSFLFSRHATPLMIAQKSGIQVFISSIAGLQGYAGEAVYCATKFAQVGFAQALDAELRPHNINVSIICPGGTKTEFALGKGRTDDYIRNSHMMDPRDVAQTIVFACMQPPNTRISQMTVRHMG